MKWLLRFLLWVTLLSVPCGFVSRAYQHALSRVAATVLAIGGQEVDIEDVQVMAPFDLAIFAHATPFGNRPSVKKRSTRGPAKLWIGTGDRLIHKAVLSGAVAKDEPDAMVRTFTLSGFNQDVTIERPA